MAKIKRWQATEEAMAVETEDGRLLICYNGEWKELPPLPETDEERERRELEARAKGLGLHVPEDS